MTTGKRSVYDVITDAIVGAIEKGGVLPWRKMWRQDGGGIARNLRTGNAYRGINAFLTGMQGYENPFWLTLKQANSFGGSVKAGEEGTPIVFWKWPSAEDKATAATAGKDVFPFARYYKVFNVTQCEGVSTKRLTEYEAAQAAKAEENTVEVDVIAGAEAIVAGWKDACPIAFGHDRAFYNPLTDRVYMPAVEKFETAEAFHCVQFHEIVHATGHQKRLGRFADDDSGAGFGSQSYSKEELVAEMGASFLAAEAGIDPALYLDNSAAYVAHWLKRLKGDSKLVMAAAGQAQRAADLVLGREFKK